MNRAAKLIRNRIELNETLGAVTARTPSRKVAAKQRLLDKESGHLLIAGKALLTHARLG
jgi:hypothetical protein